MTNAWIVQRPQGIGRQLVLLFHGVGGNPSDMAALGRRLAAEFPQAFVVSVAGTQATERGLGRQWFSVADISESSRVDRVRDAMPGFVQVIRHWQEVAQLGVEATALIGFSQGATMALESTAVRADAVDAGGQAPVESALAGRVIAIAGRFAKLPERASNAVTLHLIHGKDDAVIAYRHTIEAAERLLELDADITADVIPGVGHQINREIEDLVVQRLTGYLPRRRWDEAMQAEAALRCGPRPESER
jgi:phospholipase/carboxylesterase